MNKVQSSAIAIGIALTTISLRADAAIVDDLRITQIEQDVRELQRQVQQQSRRIDALETERTQFRPVSPANRLSIPSQDEKTKATDEPGKWLRAANWEKIRSGMSELSVIDTLGPPTTVRKSDKNGQRVMFYAMELGAGSFLSGQVVVADGQVIDVQLPKLK